MGESDIDSFFLRTDDDCVSVCRVKGQGMCQELMCVAGMCLLRADENVACVMVVIG